MASALTPSARPGAVHSGCRDRRFATAERGCWRCVLAALLLAAVGCGSDGEIETRYGIRRSGQYGRSVNGLDVFSGMFASRGYQVSTWHRLSPNIADSDVIVWAPDNFAVPDARETAFLQEWAANTPGGTLPTATTKRTLIFIGRDYDAAIEYWRRILPQAPPEQAIEVVTRRARAQADFDQRRALLDDGTAHPWFVYRRGVAVQQLQQLSGPLAAGIDPSQIDITVRSVLDVPTEAELGSLLQTVGTTTIDDPFASIVDVPTHEVLLAAESQPLVVRASRHNWNGEILIVTNGSFLLNLPLVNHQHRRLADKLIQRSGGGRKLAVLEGGAGQVEVYSQEPELQYPDDRWPPPMDLIVNQWSLVGVILCFVLYPIFGRPRQLPRDPLSDFGKHVDALGDLLKRSGNVNFARHQLQYYQQHVKRDSGASHAVAGRPAGRVSESAAGDP